MRSERSSWALLGSSSKLWITKTPSPPTLPRRESNSSREASEVGSSSTTLVPNSAAAAPLNFCRNLCKEYVHE